MTDLTEAAEEADRLFTQALVEQFGWRAYPDSRYELRYHHRYNAATQAAYNAKCAADEAVFEEVMK